MKKITGLIVKIFLGIILLILVLLFTVPVVFKEKIKIKVEQVIAESVNATVKFEDYKLGFFRDFPNFSFSLNNVSVVGVNKFQSDTLAGFKSLNLVFNLSSLFKKSGYEVNSVLIDRAVVNAIVLKDGSANWDIMKDTTEAVPAEEETSSSGMKILLKKVELLNSSISYVDDESAMKAYIKGLNFNLKGDMTANETDLQMSFNAAEFTFIMDEMKYLNKAVADAKIDMLANLDSMKFTFRENYLTINDLKLNFSGMVAMPGDDIETDLKFSTAKTSFKTLLSLIPSVYMTDYKDLKTSGEFALSGSAKGIYSDADSTLPDITIAMSVNNGLVSYPSLPEQIKNINIKANAFVDGKDMDKTIANVDLFHMELAGSPFDMTFSLKTPMSDPDFKGSMVGRIDLTALSKAVPMDSINLSGIIDMSVQMAGRMSMIEKEQYESFKAIGKMNIKNMLVAMTGYPEVKINTADFEFTPAYAALNNTNLNVGGKSDFTLNGRIENYIPYVFSDKTIKGNLSLHSKLIDASEIISKMASDTASVEDTASLAVIQVPRNIDFDFNALIDEFSYDNIKARNVKGHIIVKDGILSLRETVLNILNGTISMNADYDTRDSLKPVMKADLDLRSIAVKDAFNTFNTVQKLTPAAKSIAGNINAKLNYESLLGSDMMPVISSISGGGKLQSDEITLLKSETFDKMKDLLKLGDKYTNTFKNINASFKIADGRIYVSPFDVKTGNLKMNISGDQGIDQTLNYIVKTEIPRSDLGSSVNSLIDNLASQASAFGIAFKPSEVIKVNLKVTGTYSKPVVAPFFGNTASESAGGVKSTAKETVKQTIDNTIDKEKTKAREEAESQAARLVKEAEAKGQKLRDEAAIAAEKIRKEAEVQSQKLIDESASKGTLAKMAAQKSAESIKKAADKKANQIVQEADNQAKKLVDEARVKSDELVKKI
ncbi:MAG: AsmA family protein [Bacteroidales bacterium]|nr:AsmA family protein [Bacteroidales bacterium]